MTQAFVVLVLEHDGVPDDAVLREIRHRITALDAGGRRRTAPGAAEILLKRGNANATVRSGQRGNNLGNSENVIKSSSNSKIVCLILLLKMCSTFHSSPAIRRFFN